MKLKSKQELENTRQKLKMLEEQYEANRLDTSEDQELRDLSARSLMRLINQLKEEIVWFEVKNPTLK